MLDPTDGVTLLDALAPPTGYRLDAAVGTSFTLDLTALLAVPSGFAMQQMTTAPLDEEGPTPLGLLETLREHAARIALFSDRGHIGVPAATTGTAVLGFLEECVVPVSAPRGGLFHPKLWALRFADDDGAYLHRLLVASRNLTFDRSWDTLVRLDEADDGVTFPPLPGLLTALRDLGNATGMLSADRAGSVDDLARSIAQARFTPPPGFTDMALHPIGFAPGPGTVWPFPRDSRRTLVISPFLTHGTASRLAEATRTLTLVSRGSELDRAYAKVTEPRPAAFEINSALVEADDANVLTDLHAKVYVLDHTGTPTTSVFSGSANATGAAFGSNTEVLLELTGPTAHVGVRRWLDPDGASLGQMLVPHTWQEPGEEDEDDPERTLERVHARLGTLDVTCSVTEEPVGRFHAHYESGPLPDLEGAALSVRPLTDATWAPISEGRLQLDRTTDLAHLTGFLAVRLELKGHTDQRTLRCVLDGVPPDREERLLAHLIVDVDRLVRYLVMLLTDRPEDRFDGVTQTIRAAVARATSGGLDTVPLLELLLRTRARNPERLGTVGRLMDVVRRTPELRDDRLLDLWDAITTPPSEGAR